MDEKLKDEEVVEEKAAETKDTKKEKPKKEKKLSPKEEVEVLKLEVADLKDKLLREKAEVENFKRRVNDERIKDRKYASLNLVSDFINVLENLDLAVNFEADDDKLKNFLIGFKMINQQLFDVLITDGLTEIKTNIGDEFDPNLHYAIGEEKDEDKEDGVILNVVKKGYKYKDRIVKPTTVKINKLG